MLRNDALLKAKEYIIAANILYILKLGRPPLFKSS
jgi:hypothetical protein